MAIEIEKKYRLTEELYSEIVESLEEIGAKFAGEDEEENTLFANEELVGRNAIVRIRRTQGRTRLTYKQRIRSASDAKQQIEFESDISDAEAVRSIIEALGLQAVIVYEKRRRTYDLRQVEVVLDTLPFGLFMEIEGSITGIAEAEMLLGIEDLEVVNETYPQLTVRFGTRRGDVVEARFEKARE
jgi:adenylate cyclase, class 2